MISCKEGDGNRFKWGTHGNSSVRSLREGEMKFDLKIIIKGILIALCIYFGALLAVGFVDRILFEPKSVFARTVKGFEAQKDQIQILFLGQSDMKDAIIPKAMPYPSYNFADRGENFVGTYFKLKHYIDKTPHLKMVVLPLNLNSFATAQLEWVRGKQFPKYFSYGYINYEDFMELYQLMGFKVVLKKMQSLLPFPDSKQMKTFWQNLGNLVRSKPVERSEIHDGYIKDSGDKVEEESARVAIPHRFRKKYKFDEGLLTYFEKILVLCHSRGIKVVTLSIPVTDYYITHAEKYVTRAALYERVVANPRFSPYIYRHIDNMDLYAKNHTLFKDVIHLNHKGAIIFSEQIASELSGVMEQIQKTS
jgi:hypothetical protein